MKRKNLNLCVALLPLLAACATSPEEIHVIPAPQEVQLTGGHFQAAGAPVSYDAATVDEHSRQHIHQFAQDLTVVTGRPSRVAETAGEKGFLFRIDPAMAPESYVLEVDRRQVRVTAADDHGTLYAIRTLSQMLPASFFSKEAAPSVKWTIPCAVIHDAPRFAYRGMHLDVARHFFSVEEVKKYLDVMSLHKMNRFHWHLTEDQGWRIEIKKYPLLTEIGAWRDSTVVGHLRDMDKARKFDGQRYGGFYTQEQIRDVVAYAADLGITVIPEIDLPGHMLGALAAYPELGCTGGPYQVWCRWGISDQVLCPGTSAHFLLYHCLNP